MFAVTVCFSLSPHFQLSLQHCWIK